MFCKNGSHIQEQLPTLAPRLRGGVTPLRKFGLTEEFFSWANMAAVWIGWIEVGILSVRSSEVSVGISRGRIVDSAGYLARFRLDEWGIVWGITSIRRKEGPDYIT